MSYGWMPRILQIAPKHTNAAMQGLNATNNATATSANEDSIADIAKCLHSVVGTSKVLHFVNDTVFPIWDESIATLRIGRIPGH